LSKWWQEKGRERRLKRQFNKIVVQHFDHENYVSEGGKIKAYLKTGCWQFCETIAVPTKKRETVENTKHFITRHLEQELETKIFWFFYNGLN
jgi:hypothetical protein